MIDHPQASLEKLMEYIPGPDFPTGGILQGKDEIKKLMKQDEEKLFFVRKQR